VRISAPGALSGPTRGTAAGFKAAVLVLVAVGLMVSDQRQNHLAWVRNVIVTAAWPLRWLVHSPVVAGEWLGATFATRERLLEDNHHLRDRQALLELRLLRFEALEAENQRLRAISQAVPTNATRSLMAEVLRVDLGPFRQRVIINQGSQQGVFLGQAVVDAHGIVGQVRRVGSLSAEVILLSDPEHAIPVQVNRNGLRTLVSGTGQPDTLALPYLSRNADIRVGDLLLSSGLGGVFPAGAPVARVSEVRRDPTQPLAIIRATPLATLDRDREVLLIWFAAPTIDVDTNVLPDNAPQNPSTGTKR
jgi:rod shape-determining protein MreC